MKKVGLALGGGAAKGFAHVGVIKVLEEQSIIIDLVVGTSVGSLIGCLYCAGIGWRKIKEVTDAVRWGNLLSFRPKRGGLFLPDKMERTLNDLLGDKNFDQLDIPFAVTAVNVKNGAQVVLSSGNVARAVRASCSVPGIFLPAEIDGMVLIDGGIKNSVPADVLHSMGADIIIGVNLNSHRLRDNESARSTVKILRQTINIMTSNNASIGMPFVDVCVNPDTAGYGYGSLRPKEELFQRGEEAMTDKLPALKKILHNEVNV